MILQGRNLTQGLTGADVADLHQELGQLGYAVPATEQQGSSFGPGTLNAVREFLTDHGLQATDIVDAATAAALGQAILASTYKVTGTVLTPNGQGLGGLAVELVDKNVGGDVNLANGATDADGGFSISVVISARSLRARHKTSPDLQVQVSTRTNFLAASAIDYNAPPTLTLDVVVPADAAGLPSEYETLTSRIATLYTGRLGALQETDQQQDITYLANKTGWDARAVALAALADQFSQITAPTPISHPPVAQITAAAPLLAPTPPSNTPVSPPVPMPVLAPATVSLKPEFYYALFRAGFPANADSLFQASSKTVEAVWQEAIKQGVIPEALTNEVAGAVQTFQTLSAAHILDAAPPVGIYTLREMLQTSLSDRGQQQTFADLYSQHRDDPATFWTDLENALGAAPTKQLQLNGQLFYLTLNNASLVSALAVAERQDPLTSTLDLATRGYYDPAKWMPLIGSSIPPQIAGTGDQQRSNYAQLLATQVRLAFPTAVVADLVQRGTITLSDSTVQPAAIANFLTANQGRFEIGIEPVEAFIARTKLVGTTAPVIAEIMRLQRVLQMTRDDQTMAVLLQYNLDSAYAIMRYDAAGFVRAFQGKLGGASVASEVYARAKQIHGAVLNIVISYLGARIAPTLGGKPPHPPPHPPPPPPHPSQPIIAYPTLERLFGNLDYCDCQECRSILSPAAYLVDLLHYVDRPSPTYGFQNPQSVLLQRRPDLQYLPLTCENTNTALPYIDIVNETLEYYVANKLSLAGYQGHDTGNSVTSAELMASPQYVNDAAYTALQKAFFPPPLPFNRPLELLRLHLQKIGVALPDVMAALRINDAVDRPTPTSYGWRDILLEQLGISRDEYPLFTDSTNVNLQALYGYPPTSNALAILKTISLQDFSRQTGVSYDDLFSIIKTWFINPNANLIPKLERLNVPFTTLKKLKDNQLTQAQFEALLPPGLDVRQYEGNIVNWVKDDTNYTRIMDIITIANPNPSSSADECSGSTLQFRYANPDNTANTLSATDFVKLIRFIRLWRKLGLSIEQTDNILAALYPAPAAVNLPLLDAGFQTFLVRSGFLFQVMNRLNLTADTALAQLLACWAPIGTVGDNALYRKRFLTPTLLQDSGAQTATVGGPFDPGDVLTTTINDVPISYPVQAGDTTATIASNIVKAINTTSMIDPTTNLPLNSRIIASSQAGDITITAGFTLACSLSAGATETYTPATQSPLLQQTATVAGTAKASDLLTTTINGIAIPYTVVAGDTAATIAAHIASAINSTATQDPFCALPLNTLVLALSASGVITVNAVNSGAPFTLACSVKSGDTATYVAGLSLPPRQTATVSGSVAQGDSLTTTINSAVLPYRAGTNDTNAADLASSIATMINGSTLTDPSSTLPVNNLVSASATGGVITFTAKDPTSPFKLACVVNSGAESYTTSGPLPASQSAEVAGTFAAGRVLTTTIDGIAIPYTTIDGDGPISIAVKIADAINAPTTRDPATNLPLNKIVSAAAGPVKIFGGKTSRAVIVTAKDPTTTFTLSVSLSTASYTAGRQLSPFADDGYGNYLHDPSQTLFGHEAALCAACNLTGAEFALITTALNFDAKTTLTLANVSAIFRFGWFAVALGLKVAEFLHLRESSNLDPFAPLDPGGTPPAEPPVIRSIRLRQALAAAGLRPAQALYLMWNDDISGKSAPRIADGLARTLRSDFAAVESQFTLVADPDGSIAKRLMALVYDSKATDFFFGLLNNTFTTSVLCGAAQPTLAQPIIDASTGRLSYDDLRKQLTFAGVLDTATQTAIDQAITHNGDDPALHAALASLGTANNQAVSPFFATYKELLPLYTAYVASSDPAQTKRTTLLANFLPTLKHKRKQEQALASITAAAGTDPGFATALLQDPTILHAAADPTLAAFTDLTALEAQGLSAQFFLTNNPASTPDLTVDSVAPLSYAQTATIGGSIKPSDVLTTRINGIAVPYTVAATDASFAVLAGHIATIINQTNSLNHLISASANGATITIAAIDPTAGASFTLACSVSQGATETYTAGTQLPAGTGGSSIAGIWSGYIDVPQDGFYDISVATDAGAVTLQIGDVVVAMVQTGNVWSNHSSISLTAGALAPIVLTAKSIKNSLSVSWKSVGLGWQVIPSGYLYSATLVDRLHATYVRFLKATSLATALSLTANEIAYLGTSTSFRVNTTDNQSHPAGTVTYTPASMANIGTGSALVIDSGAAQESVTVTAFTATTFTATTTKPHNGTVTPFPIVSQAFPSIGQGWLNFLAVSDQPEQDPAMQASLRGVLTGLLDFARIKQALSPNDERLLSMLQNPTPSALASLTGWAQNSVNALLRRFFGNSQVANLSSVENFRRVYDAYAFVKTCRITDAALIAATTNAPSATTAGRLQSALRAQYAEPDWLTVVRPINDAMRIRQRDALVTYILQQFWYEYEQTLITIATTALANGGDTILRFASTANITSGMQVRAANILTYTSVTAVGTNTVTISPGILGDLPAGSIVTFDPGTPPAINTADKLFEYFLIDVETQPLVETSRIRLALSSVQLFIERILHNLEPLVSPSDIDGSLWPWMKRYRVWQANREVFLWPENWLYPELRDDQSPFFQEMMSALLQSDITDDAAANAYLDYLTNLEAVAKLEPCGVYYVAPTSDADEISYVIARTAGAHRKYYFRMLRNGSWTPWTEVKIDCEDMPITPIVWNGRLFLFWLKILKQAPAQAASFLPTTGRITDSNFLGNLQTAVQAAAPAQNKVTVQAVLCWSEFYNGKWQPTKTSDVNRPTTLETFDATGEYSFDVDRNLLRILPAEVAKVVGAPAIPSGALILAIRSPRHAIGPGGFVLYNTHSLPARFEDITGTVYVWDHFHKKALVEPLSYFLTGPSQGRSLAPIEPYTGGNLALTFSISYWTNANGQISPIYDNNLIRFNWTPRYVEPQPGLANAWDAPFFFEDRRNVFYVTTSETYPTIFDYPGFGILSTGTSLQGPVVNIPPLVFQQQPKVLAKGDPILAANAIGGGGPMTVRAYLSQSTTIRAGIGSVTPISYQGRQISVSGSAADPTSIVTASERDT